MTTRDRLVAAMSTSMRQRGYGSSAMKEVIDDADATAGSLYHFFPGGKEELATAAVREVGRASTDALAAIVEAADSVAAGSVEFYDVLIAEMQETDYRLGCPIGVPSTEAPVSVEAVRIAGAETFAAWVDVIARGLEGEGWEGTAARRAARFVVCAYEGASTLARATHDTSYLLDTRDVVTEVLSGG